MRVQRVVARAFGPLRDEALELAPGMTVVAGPNEAGKSTWHAAIRMALTGVRRGRGRATAAEAALEQRHRPWDLRERWEVEARIQLADGRTIDLQQDLAGKVACRAVDVALGRDVSDEIMDGTPDASRWLGLDRESFAATVCVNQAQITAVASPETASLLQEHIQRAAATRGTDATAAEAIDRLAAFRREAVGFDRAGARGPLRAARLHVEQADLRLADARRQHGDYLERTAEAERAARRDAEARRGLTRAEAALARHRAAEAAARFRQASGLAERHPLAPPAAAVRDATADAVAAALDGWRRRPELPTLAGRTSAELTEELARLPGEPSGDQQAHPSVAVAARELDLADAALQAIGDPPPNPRQPAADEATLRRLATILREAPAASDRAAAATERRSGARQPSPAVMALAAVLILAGAGAFVMVDALLPAIALVVSGVILAAWTLRSATIGARPGGPSAERRVAAREAAAAGLPADPDALDALADQATLARLDVDRLARWSEQRRAAVSRRAAAELALAAALQSRSAYDAGDVREALAGYLAACEARARTAREAAGAEPLRRELEARTALERSAAEADRANASAEQALRAAARGAGVGDEAAAPDELVAALLAWQRRRADEVQASERAVAEWQQLIALLDGRSLDDLRLDAERRAAEAAYAVADAGGELPDGPVDEDMLAALRREASRAERELAERTGALEVMGADLPDVAGAEEERAAAGRALAAVEALATVIDETLRLLRAAEERVHRDLAPILAGSVQRWLPVVSGGAYVQASVDPADLAIRVKEARSGRWRDAQLLSEGTREQIYLLLRIAMAQHLVRPGEVTPLFLDEVTAQSDADRREQLLTVLRELSREHQVVLFTHDHAVLAWAEAHLAEPQDRVVRLSAVAVQAREHEAAGADAVASLPVG